MLSFIALAHSIGSFHRLIPSVDNNRRRHTNNLQSISQSNPLTTNDEFRQQVGRVNGAWWSRPRKLLAPLNSGRFQPVPANSGVFNCDCSKDKRSNWLHFKCALNQAFTSALSSHGQIAKIQKTQKYQNTKIRKYENTNTDKQKETATK